MGTHENHRIQELREKVEDFDIKAETTNGLENNDIIERISLMKELEALEHIKRMDLMQKAKVKWCIDGDENSKKFHGMINNKLSKSRIKGITINGSWETDPSLAISHIFNFHKQKFHTTSQNRPRFSSNLFKTLTNLDLAILDAPFSCDEIKEAFELDGFIPRGCNSSFIALIPKIQDPLHVKDFRPIGLIGYHYKVIAKVLANRLSQVVQSV
ncbi:hypothetical protein Tco_0559533, partial [Tanacetum coccineum]